MNQPVIHPAELYSHTRPLQGEWMMAEKGEVFKRGLGAPGSLDEENNQGYTSISKNGI